MNKRIGGTLHDWYKVAHSKRPMAKRVSTKSNDEYEYEYFLSGTIEDDDKWNKDICYKLNKYDSLNTSLVVRISETEVETQNTIYKLADKHENFDKIWEDSKQALVPWKELDIPHYQINEDHICSIPVSIQYKYEVQDNCTIDEVNWSGRYKHIDHPSFALLRDTLEAKGNIHTERSWTNGDTVLKPFYLNGILFEEGEQFLSASAMKHKLIE